MQALGNPACLGEPRCACVWGRGSESLKRIPPNSPLCSEHAQWPPNADCGGLGDQKSGRKTTGMEYAWQGHGWVTGTVNGSRETGTVNRTVCHMYIYGWIQKELSFFAYKHGSLGKTCEDRE